MLQNTVITTLAEKYSKTPAQIILRWHIDAGHIVIPKSSHSNRIYENSQIFDFSLNANDMESIPTLNDPSNRIGPDPAIKVVL